MPGFSIGGRGDAGNNSRAAASVKPYYTYTWRIDTLFADHPFATETDGGAVPLVYARDLTFPTFTTQVEQTQGSSLIYKHADSVRWDPIRVTWYDTTGLLPIIQSWRRAVWSPETGVGIAESNTGYKRETCVSQITYDGTDLVSWFLKGSWPAVIRYGEVSYSNSDVKIVEVTVEYDWAEEEFTTTL